MILHIGTNDAKISGAQPDGILDALLHLTSGIENEPPTCELIISTPVKRMGNHAARKIMDSLHKKLVDLNLCRIDNGNIGNRDIGGRGLH